MSKIEDTLFGAKDSFGIEVARCFDLDGAIFGGACLWVGGKSIGDLSSTMAFHTLACELGSLAYLRRMKDASLRRLLSFESAAVDFAMDELEREEPWEISRVSPGECFDSVDLRVVAGAYDIVFFARAQVATGYAPTMFYLAGWGDYLPPARAFRRFVLGPAEDVPL